MIKNSLYKSHINHDNVSSSAAMSTQIGGANKLGPGAANGSSAVDVSPAQGAKSGEQQVKDYNGHGREEVCNRSMF